MTPIYQISKFFNETIGYIPSILIPFALLSVLILSQIKIRSFNLTIFIALFSIFPAFTPAATLLLGFEYFTMLNYDLQQDAVLKTAAVLLISMFTTFFAVGAMLPTHVPIREHRERHFIGVKPLTLILLILLIFAIFFLESGFIILESYGSIKEDGQVSNSSLVNQFINSCIATFLCYLGTKSRQRLALIFYITMFIILLLIARRTLALAIVILITYSFGAKTLSFKKIIFLILVGILLIFIGEVRSVGIVSYFQGARSAASLGLFFSLPGGASNLFVGTMGVIDMLGRNILSFPETIPIVLWPSGIYEASIYDTLDYDYNGGMHIATILYWNFGIAGTCLGGMILGWVTKRVDNVASRVTKDLGGTFTAMISFAFILTFPNLFWYHPIGWIKLSLAVTMGFIALSAVKQVTKRPSLVNSFMDEASANR